MKQGVIEVATRELFEFDGGRRPKPNGALDPRMVCLSYVQGGVVLIGV